MYRKFFVWNYKSKILFVKVFECSNAWSWTLFSDRIKRNQRIDWLIDLQEFTTRNEAMDFSQFKVAPVADQSFKRAMEPRSPFPSPSQADKDLLVASVAAGDCSTVQRLAWKNPRLLVTPDDAPLCYRGTWRQTVLHLAVQAQHFPLFCTLMEVIDSASLASLTQLTEFENLTERRNVIVSNYLNNRNKREESVLDCAVIYGVVEIVDFLTVRIMGRLIDWLIDWLNDRVIGLLFHWLIDWFAGFYWTVRIF